MIASVDGDKHKSLATKYDVSGYPTLKLFPAGSEEPSTVEIARDLETLLAYVNDHAGTDIASDGGVTAAGGIVPEIAESIRQLLSAESADERASIAEACAATVQGLDEAAQEKFRYYERVFRKIDKHGAGYVAKEHGRLTGMLEGEGNLQVESKRMFQRRINVLKQFDEL